MKFNLQFFAVPSYAPEPITEETVKIYFDQHIQSIEYMGNIYTASPCTLYYEFSMTGSVDLIIHFESGYTLDSVSPDYSEDTFNKDTGFIMLSTFAFSEYVKFEDIYLTSKQIPQPTFKRLYVNPNPINKTGNYAFYKLVDHLQGPILPAGIYVWNNRPQTIEIPTTALTFKSNNVVYNSIKFIPEYNEMVGENMYNLYYGTTIALEMSKNKTAPDYWYNQAYKTITIEEDQEVSQEFKDFVDANSTYSPLPTSFQVTLNSASGNSNYSSNNCYYSINNSGNWIKLPNKSGYPVIINDVSSIKFKAIASSYGNTEEEISNEIIINENKNWYCFDWSYPYSNSSTTYLIVSSQNITSSSPSNYIIRLVPTAYGSSPEPEE